MSSDFTTMGKITSVFGVKGWVKVISYTEPKENIASYKRWQLLRDGKQQSVDVTECRAHGNGLVAKLKDCDDRELAKQQYCGALIQVATSELPALGDDECYWHQLEGLKVVSTEAKLLGRVSYLFETGSNDVLVVKPCAGSMDVTERLIPYLPEQVIKKVDLVNGEIVVDWDPDF